MSIALGSDSPRVVRGQPVRDIGKLSDGGVQLGQLTHGDTPREGIGIDTFLARFRGPCVARINDNHLVPEELTADYVCGCVALGYMRWMQDRPESEQVADYIIRRYEVGPLEVNGMTEDEQSAFDWAEADLFFECLGDPQH